MPASRSERAAALIDRLVFTTAVLLPQALRIHEIEKCCIPDPCLGATALKRSVARMQQESGEMIDELRTGRRTKRRSPTVRPETGSYRAAQDIQATRNTTRWVGDPDYDLDDA